MAKVKEAELKKMAKALNESGLLSKKIKLGQDTDELLEDFLSGMEEVDDADQLEELDEALIDYYEEVAEDEEETEADDDEEEEEKPKPKKKGAKKKVANKKTAKGKTSKSKKKKTEEEVEEKSPKKKAKKKGGKKTGSKKTAKKDKDGAKKKGSKKSTKKTKEKKEKKEVKKNKFGRREGSMMAAFDDMASKGVTLKEFKTAMSKDFKLDDVKSERKFFGLAKKFAPETGHNMVLTYAPEVDDCTVKIKMNKS